MHRYNPNSKVELDLDETNCQAYVTVTPRRTGGSGTTAQQIMALLRESGIVYGYLRPAIIQAAHYSEETNMPPLRFMVAQGIAPVDGVDGRVRWAINEHTARQPLPRTQDGCVDYFAIPAERRVTRGSLIAVIIPPARGAPGATITAPLKPIPPDGGRNAALIAGPGITTSADRQRFFAAEDGVVEVKGNTVIVHPVQIHDSDLGFDTLEFPGGLAVRGDVKGTRIRARGPVVIRGIAAGATIRALGEVRLTRAARCTIVTEENVRMDTLLRQCTVITRRRILGAAGTQVSGGSLIAGEGLIVGTLGSADTDTRVAVGFDKVSAHRLDELEAEISRTKEAIHQVAQALRPLSASPTDGEASNRRKVMQALKSKREQLEASLRDLLSEKRITLMRAGERMEAAVVVQCVVHPRVHITIHHATLEVTEPIEAVAFVEDADRGAIRIVSLADTRLVQALGLKAAT
ncbi:MAG: DUF342 domain-containing protein [Chthonomonadales bacterium]